MIIISEKKHISTIISSINKVYNRAKINGKLSVKDIYYLHVIYKLLTNDLFDLTLDENNLLVTTYNKLAYLSKDICPPIILKTYQTTPKITFEQAEVEDCNNIIKNKSILYWQEVYTLNNSQITNLVDDTNYLVDKPSDTYENFEIGKNIDYTKVGKIIFLALESNTTNYQIKDFFNNDVTHTFNIQFVPVLNATLFISDNVYSYGTQNFKIIKL